MSFLIFVKSHLNYISNNKTRLINLFLRSVGVSILVALLLWPNNWVFSFLAHQLEYSYLVFIFSIFLTIPSFLLRKGLVDKSPECNLISFLIPCFIIVFLWILYHLGYLSNNSAEVGTALVIASSKQEVIYYISKGISGTLFGNNQMVIIGGTIKSTGLTTVVGKIITTSLYMDEKEFYRYTGGSGS